MIKNTKKTKAVKLAPPQTAPLPVLHVATVPAPAPTSAGAKPAISPAATVPTVKPRATPGKVSVEFVRPQATSVAVAGSFNGWRPEAMPLHRVGNGRWVGDLAVAPGRYEYLFVVDGEWLPDPNAKETVENPFGGRNSVMTVSA